MEERLNAERPKAAEQPNDGEYQTISWFAPGERKVVEVNGVPVIVRFVGRKGRRARIAVISTAVPQSGTHADPSEVMEAAEVLLGHARGNP